MLGLVVQALPIGEAAFMPPLLLARVAAKGERVATSTVAQFSMHKFGCSCWGGGFDDDEEEGCGSGAASTLVVWEDVCASPLQ